MRTQYNENLLKQVLAMTLTDEQKAGLFTIYAEEFGDVGSDQISDDTYVERFLADEAQQKASLRWASDDVVARVVEAVAEYDTAELTGLFYAIGHSVNMNLCDMFSGTDFSSDSNLLSTLRVAFRLNENLVNHQALTRDKLCRTVQAGVLRANNQQSLSNAKLVVLSSFLNALHGRKQVLPADLVELRDAKQRFVSSVVKIYAPMLSFLAGHFSSNDETLKNFVSTINAVIAELACDRNVFLSELSGAMQPIIGDSKQKATFLQQIVSSLRDNLHDLENPVLVNVSLSGPFLARFTKLAGKYAKSFEKHLDDSGFFMNIFSLVSRDDVDRIRKITEAVHELSEFARKVHVSLPRSTASINQNEAGSVAVIQRQVTIYERELGEVKDRLDVAVKENGYLRKELISTKEKLTEVIGNLAVAKEREARAERLLGDEKQRGMAQELDFMKQKLELEEKLGVLRERFKGVSELNDNLADENEALKQKVADRKENTDGVANVSDGAGLFAGKRKPLIQLSK